MGQSHGAWGTRTALPPPHSGTPGTGTRVSVGTPNCSWHGDPKLLLAWGPQSRCWHGTAPGPQPRCGSPRLSPIPAPPRGGCLHPPCPHPQVPTAAQLSHVHPSTRLPCSPSGTLRRAMGPCAHPRASPPLYSRPPPPGWAARTSSLCAGGEALEDALREGRPKATAPEPSTAPARAVNSAEPSLCTGSRGWAGAQGGLHSLPPPGCLPPPRCRCGTAATCACRC